MRDKYSDLIRVGKVSSINYEKCTVQVVYEDRHNLVSGDLHILVPFTLKDHVYYMPDIGERVLCIFDPSSPTKGYIVGSYYADIRLPPIQNRDKRYVKFEDGTVIEYDRNEHKVTITIPVASQGDSSIEVFAESDIKINTNGNVDVKSAKDVSIEVAQNITIMAMQDINIKSATKITMDAPDIILNGNIQHDGNITTGGTHTDSVGSHCSC